MTVEIQLLYKKLRELDVMRGKRKEGSRQHEYLSKEIGKVMKAIRRLRSERQHVEPSA
jgi:hypothetical protein